MPPKKPLPPMPKLGSMPRPNVTRAAGPRLSSAEEPVIAKENPAERVVREAAQRASGRKPFWRAVRFRLMPITMTMLGLIFVLKLSDIYQNTRQLNELLSVREAKAADAPDSKSAEPKGDAKAEEKKSDEKSDAKDEKKGEKKEGEKDAKPEEEPKTLGAGKTTIKAIEEIKSKQNQQQFTQTELDLLQNLVKRREELEKREQDLQLKSAVLDATEKRINDKLNEMKTLQADLGKVVDQYNKHQEAEIRGLVKIYESMKPGDAANIFNQLDMQILLEVIDKMAEKKVAPVLAAMDPKRARDVTQQLAELRRGRVAMRAMDQAPVVSPTMPANSVPVAAPAPAATPAAAAPATAAPAPAPAADKK